MSSMGRSSFGRTAQANVTMVTALPRRLECGTVLRNIPGRDIGLAENHPAFSVPKKGMNQVQRFKSNLH